MEGPGEGFAHDGGGQQGSACRRPRVDVGEVGLGQWLASLPQGLETVLDGSDALSAGEAQLLAFARLFLVDPGLVVLDEASSRLDPHTESLITAATDRLLVGRTVVIIAHRLSTLDRADRILVLHQGRIREEGTHDELIAKKGIYYRLYQLQYS